MLNQYLNQGADRRLDPEKQREVIELAARLQEFNRDHVSETELEELAVEAGLEREYVREAIRKLTPSTKAEPVKKTAQRATPAGGIWPEVTIGLVIFLWAFLCSWGHQDSSYVIWPLVGSFLLALGVGAVARFRGLALTYGIIIGGVALLGQHGIYGSEPHLVSFTIFGLTSLAAYSLRQWLWPSQKPAVEHREELQPNDRLERLEQMRLLRLQLESERTVRAFLSVDAVASAQMKAQLGDLEAERVFGLYQRWIATTVANFGGEVGSSAGDGAMAMFPNGTSALRCAKALQAGIGSFNAQNGGSVQIRCGISEGAVPWKPGTTIGMIHSPVVDRAAIRQKQAPTGTIAIGEELLSEAAYEFGGIQALSDTTGERVFYGTVK